MYRSNGFLRGAWVFVVWRLGTGLDSSHVGSRGAFCRVSSKEKRQECY